MSKKSQPVDPAGHIAVFQEKTIRRAWHNEEWWFSVVDVVGVLTDSTDVKQYIKKMRSRDPMLDANWGTSCTPLPLLAPDGKLRASNCANTEGLFRIIQSIPSPQAEPFKRWLAQVGYERVKEIENPELAMSRMQDIYEKKGYPLFVFDVAAALKKHYRDFNHYNLKNPLDELLFIICSTKTSEASYRNTFRSLKEAFPTHYEIAEAPAEYIARPIVSGGLSNQKSKVIRELFDVIVEEFGEPTLKPLRKMSDEEAEAFLLSLPGVGKKVARCVLMYS